MKKVIAILAVLLMAAPVMAAVNITAVQVGETNEVEISYQVTGTDAMVRSFALDITVDNGNVIKKVTPKFVGECITTSGGYGIFMGSITFNADGTVKSNGTPVCDPLEQPGTQPGLGSAGVTIEMASLYDTNPTVVVAKPGATGKLCSIFVNPIDQTKLFIKTNVGRSGIVLENGNSSEDTGATKVTTNLPTNPQYNITLNFPEPEPDVCIGDVVQDEYIDITDAFQIVTNLKATGDDWYYEVDPTKREDLAADIVKDGYIDISDAFQIVTYLKATGDDWYYACGDPRFPQIIVPQ